MERYTIYCTEEQTKKALELGAPIENIPYYPQVKYEVRNFFVIEDTAYMFPTAEQMIGWLEEQRIFVHISPCLDICCSWHISSKSFNKYGYTSSIMACKTRKEAILSAIDAALDY